MSMSAMEKRVKMLLVDDSEQVRSGMRIGLDWSAHGIDIVGEAEDGAEALALLAELKPDIIISDVLMPHMNGLELTEQALALAPHAKIILLSGYDDFAYVQTAIRHGAFDYLLKPTEVEELLKVVNKAKESMERERSRIRTQEQLQQQLHQSLPVLKERYLRSLCAGRITLSELRDKHPYIPLSIASGPIACIVLDVADEALLRERGQPYDEQLLLFAFRNMAEELARERFCAEVLESDELQLTLLLSTDAPRPKAAYIEELQALARKIKYYISHYYKVPVTLGIGGICDEPARIPEAVQEAALAAQYRLYSGKEAIVYYGDIDSRSGQERPAYPYELEKKLGMALKIGDRAGAEELAAQFLRATPGDSPRAPHLLRSHCLQLAYALLRLKDEWELKAEDGDEEEELSALDARLRKLKTREQLEAWLVRHVAGLAELVEGKMQQHRGSMIQKAIAFMERHYARDISLAEIAESVFLTPNYFAQLFKERTGDTAINYLQSLRIDKAKQLLRQTDGKLADIAVQIGYTDAKYFGQVFKKIVGLTPLEYRKTR